MPNHIIERSDSAHLQHYLDHPRDYADTVVLLGGDYDVHPSAEYNTLNLKCVKPYGVRVTVREDGLLVGHNSHIRGITWIAAGDHPIFYCDNSARARIEWNFLENINGRGPGGEPKADDIEPMGYGIVTTNLSTSENNWGVYIVGNEFRFFRAGIETRTPGESPVGGRVKGTSYWTVYRNGFDGCSYGINALRAELWEIRKNHIQLHRKGIFLSQSHTNWLYDNDFERGSRLAGNFDIGYDDRTCYTLAFGNTPGHNNLNKWVRHARLSNVYARWLKKLNIWADCGKGLAQSETETD